MTKQLKSLKKLVLKAKYQKIFNLARPFYKKGREGEEDHHLIVAYMMQHILREVDLDKDIMIVAALLHDIGYAKIPPRKRKIHWGKQVRRDHMKFGSELAGGILKKINYPPEKIEKVCQIIKTHDNPTIGLNIDSKEGRILKEADILWMTTERAFWLDVKRRWQLGASDWLKVLKQIFTKEKSYIKYLKTDFSKKRTKEFLEKMEKKVKNLWRNYV